MYFQKTTWSLLIVLLIFVLAACGGAQDETPTPPPATAPPATEEPAEEPEPTAVPEPTDEPEPTAVPEPTEEPEPTAVPTEEPTIEPTPTEEPAPVGPTEGPDLILVERPGLFPEGIEYDVAGGRFLLSSIGEGTIYTVNDDGTHQPFIEDADFLSTLGLEIDVERNRLLVANSNAAVFTDPTLPAQTFLGVYDLTTGERLHMISLVEGEPERGYIANDIAVDAAGNAYVTDSFGPAVYKVDMDGNASVFVEQFGDAALVSPNGIVYHPDGYLLVADAANGAIFRVPLDNPEGTSQVELEQPIFGDGMVLHPNGNLIVVDFGAAAILSLSSDDDWASATIEATSPDHPASTIALRGEQVYAIYPHFDQMANGESPEAFEIVLVEFGE